MSLSISWPGHTITYVPESNSYRLDGREVFLDQVKDQVAYENALRIRIRIFRGASIDELRASISVPASDSERFQVAFTYVLMLEQLFSSKQDRFYEKSGPAEYTPTSGSSYFASGGDAAFHMPPDTEPPSPEQLRFTMQFFGADFICILQPHQRLCFEECLRHKELILKQTMRPSSLDLLTSLSGLINEGWLKVHYQTFARVIKGNGVCAMSRNTASKDFNQEVAALFRAEAEGVLRKWVSEVIKALLPPPGQGCKALPTHILICLPTITDDYLKICFDGAAKKAKKLLEPVWEACRAERVAAQHGRISGDGFIHRAREVLDKWISDEESGGGAMGMFNHMIGEMWDIFDDNLQQFVLEVGAKISDPDPRL